MPASTTDVDPDAVKSANVVSQNGTEGEEAKS